MFSYPSKNAGFNLVEVMVAVLVLALGLIGIAKFQAGLIKGGSDAKQRSEALALAERKIDDFRKFTSTNSPGDPRSFISYIGSLPCTSTSCVGGDIAFGTTLISGIPYDLSWEITDCYAGASDTAGICAVSEGFGDSPGAVGVPDYKDVKVLVSWADEAGIVQPVSLRTVIDALPPENTGLASAPTLPSPTPPEVKHTPGLAPDVIPICEGGVCKEAEKPEPEISQNAQFKTIEFAEITYLPGQNNLTTERQDFITVNCACNQAGTGLGWDPTTRTVNSSGNTLIDKLAGVGPNATPVTKRIGTRPNTGQLGQQSEFCSICCRDHHDRTGAPAVYDPFRPSSDYMEGDSGDHNHYIRDNGGNLVLANENGDTYYEACRLKRVNGQFRVVQDWKLETLKVVPAETLLDSTKVVHYTSYVKNFVQDYVTSINDAYPGTTPTPTTVYSNEPDDYVMQPGNGNAKQMVSRGVFIDFMDDATITAAQAAVSNNNVLLALRLIPFHEVNLTSLATWSSSDTAQATVTSEPIEDNNTHSRGLITAIAGTPDITATIGDSNSGLTNSAAMDPYDSTLVSDAITLDVGGTPPSTGPTISGAIRLSRNSALDLDDPVVQGGNGAVCQKTLIDTGNDKRIEYSCTLTVSGDGTIKFSNYNVLVKQGNNIQLQNNKVCSADSVSVTNNREESEFSTVTYSGVTSDQTNKDVTIKKADESC